MSYHCQNSPKLLLQIGNCFYVKNVVLTSNSTMKIVLPQLKRFSSCATNVMDIRAGLKSQRWHATTLSFMLPSSVYMSTKPFSEIRKKNIILARPSQCCSRNKTSSAAVTTPHAFNSKCNTNSSKGLLSFKHLMSQPIHLSRSIHTCTSLYNTCSKASNNLDNSSSIHFLFNSPPPTLPKCSSYQFLSCNNQLSASTRRGLRISAQCRDIYIIESEEEFEKKVMDSKLPVVINFHADWCEPCHALKPLLETLAEKYQGRMHLAEVRRCSFLISEKKIVFLN